MGVANLWCCSRKTPGRSPDTFTTLYFPAARLRKRMERQNILGRGGHSHVCRGSGHSWSWSRRAWNTEELQGETAFAFAPAVRNFKGAAAKAPDKTPRKILQMQKFIAEVSRLIDKDAFERSWQSDPLNQLEPAELDFGFVDTEDIDHSGVQEWRIDGDPGTSRSHLAALFARVDRNSVTSDGCSGVERGPFWRPPDVRLRRTAARETALFLFV